MLIIEKNPAADSVWVGPSLSPIRMRTRLPTAASGSGSFSLRACHKAVNDTRLGHSWLRINRALRVMLQTRWSAEAWGVVRVEFRRAVALRGEIRRAG